MLALLAFISYLLTLYIYLLIAAAVLSWLVAFNVVNTRNPVVHAVGDFLYRITEPLLRPIRNLLPNLGGIDVSPVILILLILFLQAVIIPEHRKALHLRWLRRVDGRGRSPPAASRSACG